MRKKTVQEVRNDKISYDLWEAVEWHSKLPKKINKHKLKSNLNNVIIMTISIAVDDGAVRRLVSYK